MQIPRSLPWRPPATTKRSAEQVRPIFWSNRPRAYVTRTADWDSYPSGRWGNAKSPAYGTLSDYQFMRRHTGSEKRAEKAKAAWGTSLSSLQDVIAVFVKYTSGACGVACLPPAVRTGIAASSAMLLCLLHTGGGGVDVLPWSEMDSLQLETGHIKDQLIALNRAGYLTINSQPRVNGAPSTDPNVGWGGPNGCAHCLCCPTATACYVAGEVSLPTQWFSTESSSCDLRRYVYQKAYVEFFTSPANFKALEARLKAAPAITYMAVDAKQHMVSNVGPTDVNAVTWGVFPGKEVIQPTVVDPQSFMVWKVGTPNSCFAGWAMLSTCCPSGSPLGAWQQWPVWSPYCMPWAVSRWAMAEHHGSTTVGP